jgi:hypothetical protein
MRAVKRMAFSERLTNALGCAASAGSKPDSVTSSRLSDVMMSS